MGTGSCPRWRSSTDKDGGGRACGGGTFPPQSPYAVTLDLLLRQPDDGSDLFGPGGDSGVVVARSPGRRGGTIPGRVMEPTVRRMHGKGVYGVVTSASIGGAVAVRRLWLFPCLISLRIRPLLLGLN
jgi:hypothetical protein